MFQTISKDLLFSRDDKADPRRGEQVRPVEKSTDLKPGFAVAGYPDDEGIKNNGGRVGAAEGPDAIRKFLYRMVATDAAVYDVGNIQKTSPLAERHEFARKKVSEYLSQGQRWVGLGGGHDYGYADGAGFLDWSKSQKKKPLIINFDAHLDVRKPGATINSGTPFYRLSEMGIDFDFIQIGIQRQCNSAAHMEWSRAKKHVLVTLEEYWGSGVSLSEFVTNRAGDLMLQERPCFVSVDIDAFAFPYAMGASQSWPYGLEPKEFWPCYSLFLKRFDVRALGIYETSPPLDFDSGTAKLASLIVDTFIREAMK
jgi:formiminoglutamase